MKKTLRDKEALKDFNIYIIGVSGREKREWWRNNI